MSSQLRKQKIRKGKSVKERTQESRQESRIIGNKSASSLIPPGLVLKSVLH